MQIELAKEVYGTFCANMGTKSIAERYLPHIMYSILTYPHSHRVDVNEEDNDFISFLRRNFDPNHEIWSFLKIAKR